MDKILSIIIVSYNTRGLLKNCLKTISDNICLPHEVIVVDNNSPDKSADMVAKEFPKVKLIRNKKNFGYNHANNQAIPKVSGKYIFFLNPDTMIAKGSVERMVHYLEKNPGVGIIGPQIINLNGTFELSAFPLPNLRDTIEEGSLTYSIPRKSFLFRACYRSRYLPAIQSSTMCQVGWVSGAAFIIRKGLLNLLGPKDNNFYAYAEEADWAIKAKAFGYTTVYFPQSQIIHIGSASSNQSWKLICHRINSSYRERVYFAKKYFSPLAYCFLKLYLFFEIWIKYIGRSVITWQEPKRSEYLKAYLNSLSYLQSK